MSYLILQKIKNPTSFSSTSRHFIKLPRGMGILDLVSPGLAIKKNFHFLNIQPQDIFKRNYPGRVLDIVLPGFAKDEQIPLLSPL